jgi:hypothetical protein
MESNQGGREPLGEGETAFGPKKREIEAGTRARPGAYHQVVDHES